MKTRLLLLIFLISFVSVSFTQTQKHRTIDSLTSLLQKTKVNEEKIELYFQLNKEYRDVNKDTSLTLSGKALYLSKKIKNNEKIAFSHVIIGETYREMGNFPEARKNFDLAFKIAPDNLEVKGDVYENLGHIYRELDDSTNTFDYYRKALKSRLNTGNEEKIAFAYYNFGHYYSNLNKHADAQKYYLLALPLFKKVKNMIICFNIRKQ